MEDLHAEYIKKNRKNELQDLKAYLSQSLRTKTKLKSPELGVKLMHTMAKVQKASVAMLLQWKHLCYLVDLVRSP